MPADPEGALFLDQRSLDGQLRHTAGILCGLVATAGEAGLARVFVPAIDAAEAALVGGIEVLPVGALVSHCWGDVPLERVPLTELRNGHEAADALVDLAEVRGQEHTKRGLEVAAVGGHNIPFSGPPGAGKTLLARALPGILPPMSPAETLEVTRVYSVAGLLPPEAPLMRQRPFRSPHHTVSYAGLVGGVVGLPRPGEISLAHRGVLFLDELPEFSQRILEVLRQPMEDGVVQITRSKGTLSFPARFMLVGARNPCPCGFYGDAERLCSCVPATVSRYQKRLSRPILDRIDLHIAMPRIDYDKLAAARTAEPSQAVRARVVSARAHQRARFEGRPGLASNAETGLPELRAYCALDTASAGLMGAAVQRLGLSARPFHRVLRVARTIADLAGCAHVESPHLAEAIQYQPRDEG